MGLREVRELVMSYEGTRGDFNLDSRAMMLTVGDMRMLLACAEQESARVAEEDWPLSVGAQLSQVAPLPRYRPVWKSVDR